MNESDPHQPAREPNGTSASDHDEQQTRRRRLIIRGAVALAVAAAIVIAFGVGAGLRSTPPAQPPGLPSGQPITVTVATGASAEAEVVSHTWGTELRLQVSGLRQGDPYAVRFVTDAGSDVAAGSVIGTGEEPITSTLTAAVLLDDAARVLVTDSSGAVVVDGRIG